MQLKALDHELTVCKLESTAYIDLSDGFYFLSRTDEEISLVCETQLTPDNTIEREDGWKAFRICGTLDFSLIGILSRISTVLAESGIGIFAVSTFNTDYILVKSDNFVNAQTALEKAGYVFCRNTIA